MSKDWYPVINYELCTECGTCTDKCSHGVYSSEKAPRPVVVSPESCIQGCKGCGSICPGGAIEYFGEDAQVSDEGCGCGCNTENESGEDCGCGCNTENENGEDCGCGCGGEC